MAAAWNNVSIRGWQELLGSPCAWHMAGDDQGNVTSSLPRSSMSNASQLPSRTRMLIKAKRPKGREAPALSRGKPDRFAGSPQK